MYSALQLNRIFFPISNVMMLCLCSKLPNMVDTDTCKYLEYIEIEIEWFFDIIVKNEAQQSCNAKMSLKVVFFLFVGVFFGADKVPFFKDPDILEQHEKKICILEFL